MGCKGGRFGLACLELFALTSLAMRCAGDLAAKLAGIAALHPAVRIGSYPNTDMGLGESVKGRPYKVRPDAGGEGRACLASSFGP